MKTAFFVRHAESRSNAGLATETPASNPLTTAGWDSADAFAQRWEEWPSLIVTSGFDRSKQTAKPMRERFPNVPHEEWDIQEFTQLSPARYQGTTHEERKPQVQRYWEMNDPNYCDGEGAESLSSFFWRVASCLQRLDNFERQGNIILFTHGHFMRAALWLVLNDRMFNGSSAEMERFRIFSEAVSIPNLHALAFHYDKRHDGFGCWSVNTRGKPGAVARGDSL